MLIAIVLIILAVLLFGSSAVIGAIGAVLGAIALFLGVTIILASTSWLLDTDPSTMVWGFVLVVCVLAGLGKLLTVYLARRASLDHEARKAAFRRKSNLD